MPPAPRLLAVLRLEEGAQAEFADVRGAGRRLSLSEFTSWVDAVLEAASHVPPHPPREQVTILPLSQMLARPFAAAVLPGCDEVRLPAAPEPPGPWTATQRVALGLPSRAELGGAQRAAWAYALADACLRHPLAPGRRQRRAAAAQPAGAGPATGWPETRGRRPAPAARADRCAGAARPRPAAPRCRCSASPPAPTATCAPAPTASSRCASSACRRRMSWKPRSTSATSACGCTPCCATSMRRCWPRPPRTPARGRP